MEVLMASGTLAGRLAKPRKAAAESRQTADDLYEMANLFPRSTGLPMVVWVSPRGHARHDARVKVSLTRGRMDIGRAAVVGIRPLPRLIEGELSPADLSLVARWIELNEAALLDFWNEAIDSVELATRLRKLE
jgi:hypothetical protein